MIQVVLYCDRDGTGRGIYHLNVNLTPRHNEVMVVMSVAIVMMHRRFIWRSFQPCIAAISGPGAIAWF